MLIANLPHISPKPQSVLCPQTGTHDAPPHPFGVEGKYASWLWAMPGSKYDRTQALANWPPTTDGPKPLATRWWAHLQGHSLLLARTYQL